jgi:hypothetical protein
MAKSWFDVYLSETVPRLHRTHIIPEHANGNPGRGHKDRLPPIDTPVRDNEES